MCEYDALVGAYARGRVQVAARRRPRTQRALVAAGAVLAGLLPLVGAAGASAGAATNARQAKHSGHVVILYAGSLVNLMQTEVDAAFHKATGYSVTGISGGSTALAQEIKGGVHQADVFISASPTTNKTLEGASNGNWVRWYLTFATSQLMLGYNPKSSFVSTLKTEPWWKVVTEPGFRIGRTNPVTDPKGRLAVSALKQTASKENDPALAAIATKATTIFAETAMVGDLQAGQLDAGFFYDVEAKAGKIPTVPLTGVSEHATYTITVVAKAPHAAAADAFVAWVAGGKAKSLLKKEGLVEVQPPKLTGDKKAVPEAVRKEVK